MPVQLTEAAINAAIKRAAVEKVRIELADKTLAGLRIRITPAGSKGWVLACRDRLGAMRRFPLGVFPAMGISEARDAARVLYVKVKHEGADPVADRRKDLAIGKDAKEGIGTLAAVLELYGAKHGETLKSWDECHRRIKSVFAKQLSRPLVKVTVADLQMECDGWKSPQSAALAVRCLRPVLKWAAQRKYAPAGLADITPPATVKRRQRILTAKELKALLPVLKASDRPYASAILFMLLTLARREEVGGAKWRDIDLDKGVWTIPETKNGEPHKVPLSKQARALLQERRDAFLIGIASDNVDNVDNLGGKQPRKRSISMGVGFDNVDIVDNVPRASGPAKLRISAGRPRDIVDNIDNVQGEPPPDALVFAASTGGALGNWDRETKLLMKASKTEGWTRHDLRRTGATMLGEMGELPDIIEAALNHVSIRSALAATYNRSRYRPQVAAALQRLADALDGIEVGGAEVIPLHAG